MLLRLLVAGVRMLGSPPYSLSWTLSHVHWGEAWSPPRELGPDLCTPSSSVNATQGCRPPGPSIPGWPVSPCWLLPGWLPAQEREMPVPRCQGRGRCLSDCSAMNVDVLGAPGLEAWPTEGTNVPRALPPHRGHTGPKTQPHGVCHLLSPSPPSHLRARRWTWPMAL